MRMECRPGHLRTFIAVEILFVTSEVYATAAFAGATTPCTSTATAISAAVEAASASGAATCVGATAGAEVAEATFVKVGVVFFKPTAAAAIIVVSLRQYGCRGRHHRCWNWCRRHRSCS